MRIEQLKTISKTSDLKHQYAILDDKLLCAPDLQSAYGADSRHPDLRKIVWASKNRRLKCAVCGSILKRMFGSVKRWHFARFPGQVACDHENETVEHRRSKISLYEALSYSLGLEWSVSLEERLSNGRRPDVLATHVSGTRVAFEVQYSNLSAQDFQARHADYRSIGVRDVWMLGDRRQDLERDALRELLSATNGQRVIYIRTFSETEEVTVQEAIFEDPDNRVFGIGGYLEPGSVANGGIVGIWEHYGLQSLALASDGTFRTPADDRFDELQRSVATKIQLETKRREAEKLRLKRQRERLRKRREAEEARLQKQREQRRRREEEYERKRLAEQEKRRCEDRKWRESPKREIVLSRIGEELLAMFEVEREEDLHIYRPPGYWKSALYLSCIHDRPPKSFIDWLDVMNKAMNCPHDQARKGHFAREAVYEFRRILEREELIEFVRKDDKGYKRYWRTPPSIEEKQRAEKARQKAFRAEQQRKEREGDTRREALLKRLQENAALRRPAPPEISPDSTTPFVEPLSAEQRRSREAAKAKWIDSEDRRVLAENVGQKLMNVLESDHDADRYILVHPGEWKGFLYTLFLQGKPYGEKLDIRAMTEIILKRYAVGDLGKVVTATVGFLDTICTRNAGLHKIDRDDYVTATPAKIWRCAEGALGKTFR
ncbi:competence protein CoiA family protein [Rubrobacter indicoceani]|uniref:competence protein CoiA family protein n=1 Tax=Rubrobacter indicoceani TaxID=2051957 RepID=UPI000E5AF0B8|nr:competence protein CoiA family protein [Rubrobacter indicoceani]